MLDKATVLTTLFTIVDDTMKGSPMIQRTLERPGPAPHLSDSEVITLAIYQELIGEPREDHFFRLHQEQLRSYFPGLNERSRYNRRKRDLWAVILAVRVSLQIVLDALELEETAVIDSAPVPCVGYKRAKHASDFVGTANYGVCSSKAMKYFGLKLHSVVSLSGVVMGRSRSLEPVTTITRQSWNCLTRVRITSSVCLETEPTMMRPSRPSWSSIARWSCSPLSSSINSLSVPSRRNSSSIGCGSSA